MPRVEHVPGDRVVWQSDKAMTYQCPSCLQAISSQYEGDEKPTVRCYQRVAWRDDGAPALELGGHTLEWA